MHITPEYLASEMAFRRERITKDWRAVNERRNRRRQRRDLRLPPLPPMRLPRRRRTATLAT